jgi:hypothetical protein
MLQHGSSMRSEGLAAPQTQGAVLSLDRMAALEDQCYRLHLLTGELLLKNHVLRCELARLGLAGCKA